MTPQEDCIRASGPRVIEQPTRMGLFRIGRSRLAMRSYCAGDEARLVALWNRSYARYAGLATRTLEYWRWSILARPAMSQEDVLIVESGERLLGYAALWTGGKVLELAVEPDMSDTCRSRVTRQLLNGLEARARERGWDSVQLLSPACDRLIDRTLRSAGYALAEGPTAIVRLLNPAALLRTLISARAHRLLPLRGHELLITLQAGDDPVLLQHRLSVRFGDCADVRTLGDAPHAGADAELQLSLATLAELVFCGASARTLLASGELHVDPQAATAMAFVLLEALAVEAPWYTPWSETF